jgi:hypothetical protein
MPAADIPSAALAKLKILSRFARQARAATIALHDDAEAARRELERATTDLKHAVRGVELEADDDGQAIEVRTRFRHEHPVGGRATVYRDVERVVRPDLAAWAERVARARRRFAELRRDHVTMAGRSGGFARCLAGAEQLLTQRYEINLSSLRDLL